MHYRGTLSCMQRATLQIVTTLPVLIPCDDNVADGYVRDQAVRVVTKEEVIELGYKATTAKREPKGGIRWLYLLNLKLLLDAGERKDLTAARKAAEQILPYLPISSVRVKSDQAGFVRALVEHSAKDALGDGFQLALLISGTVLGCCPQLFLRSNVRERTRWYERNGIVDDGREPPAMRNELPIRAMMCPDFNRAAAYKLFFDGLGVCPRCQKLFAKTGAPNQACCSVQCRESHRMARWRERKKIEAAQKSAKKHGGRR
jgi:hypothetical protein